MKREQVRPSGEVVNDERISERTVFNCRVSVIPIHFLTDAKRAALTGFFSSSFAKPQGAEVLRGVPCFTAHELDTPDGRSWQKDTAHERLDRDHCQCQWSCHAVSRLLTIDHHDNLNNTDDHNA